MRVLSRLGPCLIAMTVFAATSSGAEKIRLLIIDGVNNHDWKTTTAATRRRPTRPCSWWA